MERFLKSFDYFKKNINVFILLPTVLGGFWQLLELINIDASFVRFFSITQVVSDGLIILFLITIYLVLHFLFFILIDDEYIEKTFYKGIYVKLFFLILTFFVIAFMVFRNFKKQNLNTTDILFSIYIFLIFLRILRDTISYWVGEQFRKNFLLIVFIIVLPLIILNLNVVFKGFHKMYYVPINIVNINYIECYSGIKRNEFELLYFNDKYVFIKLRNNQIEIINFNELLNKKNCK